MKNALKQVLDDLDQIAAQGHDEVYDTDVREEMHEAVHQTLVEPQKDYMLPDNYHMFSDEGNALVKAALAKFLAHPEYIAAKDLPTARDRLNAFQDMNVQSDEGMSYDEYFGYDDSYDK